MLGAAALQKQFPLKKNLRLCFKKRYINIENDSHRELIAVERKGRNLNSDSLWDGNDNIQSLLSGFDIEEKLLIAPSEKNSASQEKWIHQFFVGRGEISMRRLLLRRTIQH